jgi:hypothetical protein
MKLYRQRIYASYQSPGLSHAKKFVRSCKLLGRLMVVIVEKYLGWLL